MRREGNRFANLVRWGYDAVMEVLGSKEYTKSKHEVLPVPQLYINDYPVIVQNPGY